jgi:hypothetical protein
MPPSRASCTTPELMFSLALPPSNDLQGGEWGRVRGIPAGLRRCWLSPSSRRRKCSPEVALFAASHLGTLGKRFVASKVYSPPNWWSKIGPAVGCPLEKSNRNREAVRLAVLGCHRRQHAVDDLQNEDDRNQENSDQDHDKNCRNQ